MKLKLGNGQRIRFRKDCWISEHPFFCTFPRLFRLSSARIVPLLMFTLTTHSETMHLDQNFFPSKPDCQRRRGVYPFDCSFAYFSVSPHPDMRVWIPLPGTFSCKSFFQSLSGLGAVQGVKFHSIWNLFVPLKIKFCIWCLVQNKINTSGIQQKRSPWISISPQ